jgi:CrcB protein
MGTFTNHVMLAACGGAIGSAFRYLAVTLISRYYPNAVFPYGTLAVNVVGCFLIAWIGTLAADKITLNSEMRLFIFTGILGGFTTFSAFGYETFYLLRTSHLHLAVLNVLSNCLLGLGAVWFGCVLAKM